MTNDTDGVSQTSLPDRTSEEAWQVVSSSLQAVRDEPSEDLSLLAQNPLCGRDCIYRGLYDEGRNRAKQFPSYRTTAHLRNSGEFESASCCASRRRRLGDLRLRR